MVSFIKSFRFTIALLSSHLQGRPKGENKAEDKKKFSLKPVIARLSELLGQDVSPCYLGKKTINATLLRCSDELF